MTHMAHRDGPTARLLDRARGWLAEADAVFVGAGAGMGVDSGLPDFRGDEGFWRAYPPLRDLGLSFTDMADPRWFTEDPGRAWGFYGHRLALYRATEPHAGFDVLRALVGDGPDGPRRHPGAVFTSNVDGQFARAGFAEATVVEAHGSIHHLQCARPCTRRIWAADGVEVAVDPVTFRAAGDLPTCPACGGVARPNILMFGDGAWLPDRTEAQRAVLASRLEALTGSVPPGRIVVVEVGAGTAVPTVRWFCERVASRTGGSLIRINPREPEVPAGSQAVGLELPAGEALAALAR